MAEKPAENAAPAATVPPLEYVQLDGQCLLKIVKHCKECMPNLVTGQLLGLDIGSTLEVTNCFPFPVRGGAARRAKRGVTPTTRPAHYPILRAQNSGP